MENKVIKNMEYWKAKNNIPGIEGLEGAGLTDGRAGSAPFQMKDGSPLPSFWSKAANVLTGGAAGMIKKARGGDWKGGMKSLFSGGLAGGVGSGSVKDKVAEKVDEKVDEKVEEAMAEGEDGSAMAMKSPMKQDEGGEGVLGGQEIAMMSKDKDGYLSLDEENGKLMTTEQFGGEEGILINDPNDVLEGRTMGNDDLEYRYKVEEDGSYTLISKGSAYDEDKEPPAPEKAPEGPMGPGGMNQPMGGVM